MIYQLSWKKIIGTDYLSIINYCEKSDLSIIVIVWIDLKFFSAASSDWQWVSDTIYEIFFFNKIFIKNKFYYIIYIFNYYFVTIFLVFSFQK